MPQGMTTETRQKNGTVRVFGKNFIVAVADDAPDGLVQRSLMLALSKAIKVQIVLESVVLQTTLPLCPQGEHIIQGDIPRFCLDAFQ